MNEPDTRSEEWYPSMRSIPGMQCRDAKSRFCKKIEQDPGRDMDQDVNQMVSHHIVPVEIVVQGKADTGYWTI